MTTPILGIPEIANNQVNEYLTANEAFRLLESSTNDFMLVDLAAADASLSAEDFARFFLFRCSEHLSSRSINVPQGKRLFAVHNSGASSISVVRGATSVSVSPGLCYLLYTDGAADGLLAVAAGAGGGGGGNSVVESAVSSAGVLDLSAVTAETVTVVLIESIDSIILPAGLAGQRKDLMIRFQQDATGARSVDLSAFAWSGDGIPPSVSAAAGSITYVSAVNVDALGWEAFK